MAGLERMTTGLVVKRLTLSSHTSRQRSITKKTAGSQLGGSDHRPVLYLTPETNITTLTVPILELQEGRLESLLTSQQHTDKQDTGL